MNETAIDRELSEMKKERELSQKELETKMNEFANELRRGLGKEIKETLEAEIPEKDDKGKKKGAIKGFFKKVIDTCS